MKHYLLYFHAGSGNHGCEALVRTTSELLDYKNNRISLASFNPETDYDYGINKFCQIYRDTGQFNINKLDPGFLRAYFQLKIQKDYYAIDKYQVRKKYSIKSGDVALHIGGDNYCYHETPRISERNKAWKRNGLKTVLWGCSIDPEVVDDVDTANDIATYDLITARETISYNAIKQINRNTVLVSDSAFWLKTARPKLFDESVEYVGINMSPMVLTMENQNGMVKSNYERLIEYILDNTRMHILLIPHVILEKNDDRIANQYLYNKYMHTRRLTMIDDCNCEELKGYISQCRFFVGARTHACIAAYSSFIPTLSVGYSTKSLGIARDIFGTDENYVVSVQSLTQKDELAVAFKWIVQNEETIKMRLSEFIPQYKDRISLGLKEIKKL